MMDRIRDRTMKIISSDAAFKVALLITIVLVAIVLVLGLSTKGDTQATRRLSKDQKTLSERQDCARVLSTDQNEVQRHGIALVAEGLADLAQGKDEALQNRAADLRKTGFALDHLKPLQGLVDAQCPKLSDDTQDVSP